MEKQNKPGLLIAPIRRIFVRRQWYFAERIVKKNADYVLSVKVNRHMD